MRPTGRHPEIIVKLATIFAAAAALVLTACENPVQPSHGGAPLALAPNRSMAAESDVHIASVACQYNWDFPEGYFCFLTITSTGSVGYVAADWMNWSTYYGLVATAPSWSPDATRLAFTDGNEVQVVNLIGGALTNLTNHPANDASPAWSPNGEKIVFQSDREGRAELYVMNADGSSVVRLTYNAGVDGIVPDPDWAPDGSRIVFTCEVDGNRDICRINADGTGLVRLTNGPEAEFEPAWSPDGSRIVFVSGSQLKLMNADGSGTIQVATGYWRPQAPDWSPDGSRLVFQGTFQGGTGCPADGIGCPDDIMIMNADGTALQAFSTGWVPAWAPVAPPLPFDQPPVARFTYWCSGLTCYFNASGSTDDRGIYRQTWAFGDGSTSSQGQHTYAAVGIYTVTLTVTDGAGQSGSTSQTVTVTPPPDLPPFADFGWGCAGLTCNFTSAGSSDDVGIASRSWTFGDGTTAGNVIAPAKTFATPGTYTVTLTVIDTKGQSSSRSQSVAVSDAPPVARFTSSCVRTVCTFDGRSSTDDLGVASYSWEPGATSAKPATGPVVSIDYKRSGTFSVRLTVRDGGGQSNSVSQTITVQK
jgi:PKD repeat protein